MAVNTTFEKIYDAVRAIPAGRVLSYGQVAVRAGLSRGAARVVGWALRTLPPGTEVPWQRVVNRNGVLTIINPHVTADEQKRRLEKEGVRVEEVGEGYQVGPEFFWHG